MPRPAPGMRDVSILIRLLHLTRFGMVWNGLVRKPSKRSGMSSRTASSEVLSAMIDGVYRMRDSCSSDGQCILIGSQVGDAQNQRGFMTLVTTNERYRSVLHIKTTRLEGGEAAICSESCFIYSTVVASGYCCRYFVNYLFAGYIFLQEASRRSCKINLFNKALDYCFW
jgi:hypothetical protein